MNKFTKIKTAIERYNINKSVLIYWEEELKLLEEERLLKGVSYDGVKSSSGISDTVGNTAINITEKEAKLKIEMQRKKNEVKFVDNALNCLRPDEREVITRLYMHFQPYWKISEVMNCSISNCKKIRKKGFDRLMKSID